MIDFCTADKQKQNQKKTFCIISDGGGYLFPPPCGAALWLYVGPISMWNSL